MDAMDRKQKQTNSRHSRSSGKLKKVTSLCTADVSEAEPHKPRQCSKRESANNIRTTNKNTTGDPTSEQSTEISSSKRRRLRKIRAFSSQQLVVTETVSDNLGKVVKKKNVNSGLKRTKGTPLRDIQVNETPIDRNQDNSNIVGKEDLGCYNIINNVQRPILELPCKELICNDNNHIKVKKKHVYVDEQDTSLDEHLAPETVSESLAVHRIISARAFEQLGNQHLQSLTDVLNDLSLIYGPVYTPTEINNQTVNISRSSQSKPAETTSTNSNTRPLSTSCQINVPEESNYQQNMDVVPEKPRDEVRAAREAKKKAKSAGKGKPSVKGTEMKSKLCPVETKTIPNITETKSNLTTVETKPFPDKEAPPALESACPLSVDDILEIFSKHVSLEATELKEIMSKTKRNIIERKCSQTEFKSAKTLQEIISEIEKLKIEKRLKEKQIEPVKAESKSELKSVKRQEIISETKKEIEIVKTESKSELKAARRLQQEKQRALKASQQVSKTKADVPTKANPPLTQQKQPQQKQAVQLPTAVARDGSVAKHRVKLFNHLYPEKHMLLNSPVMFSSGDVHPAIVCLGAQYAQRVVVGSNARCYALLSAMKKVIDDYRTPPHKEFARGLESCIQTSMAYLLKCRPHSVSMTNALKHLKWQMTQLPNNVADPEAKKTLNDAIDTYLSDQINVAAQAICLAVQKKISDGDVILAYGCSSLVQRILVSAHESGTQFRVVVVDARPWREGRHLLNRLVQCGIKCSYVLIAAASSIMREVTKVLLGAHALLANGYVMSRAGSSQMALLAHSYNVPVLVCCETHKFCEQVQTDSFVYNEIGDPNDLVPTGSHHTSEPLANWPSIPSLTPLNITYDVTPPDLVTAVVTELAILPCTSVPVILRIKPTDAHMQ